MSDTHGIAAAREGEESLRGGPMADTSVTWTEERLELLKKLWSEGWSASQIAAEIGGGMTRNAVLGKSHRLGLVRNTSAGVSTPRPRNGSPAPVGHQQQSHPCDLHLSQ